MTAPPIDQGADLDGRAAVVFERLTRRPSWARPGSPWISQLVARQLALVETVTLEVVDAALNGARERGRGLRNPAGFVIARVREPDMLELQREQARRRSQNERDRIDAENRLRREAEASDALAVTRELERRRAALTAKLSTDELDALIQKYIETEASPVRRGMLWARTPEERRESVMRFGEIDHLLEEAVA